MSVEEYLDFNHEILSAEEELEFAELAKNGDNTARELLILTNLRLVYKICHQSKLISQYPSFKDDIISQGIIGLLRGIDDFDPSYGFRLSTFVTHKIKMEVGRYHRCNNLHSCINYPAHSGTTKGVILGAMYSTDEHIHSGNIFDHYLKEAKKRNLKTTYGESVVVSTYESMMSRTISGNVRCADDSDDEEDILETVAAEDVISPEQSLIKESSRKFLNEILDSNVLTDRESSILRLRFGFGDERSKTLEEVAEYYGITRERIRQLQDIALEKIRKRLSFDDIQEEDFYN